LAKSSKARSPLGLQIKIPLKKTEVQNNLFLIGKISSKSKMKKLEKSSEFLEVCNGPKQGKK
jgi:hypothetical protein